MQALNKKLALVLWAKDDEGKDDVSVFSGTLIQNQESYYLERKDGSNPEIRQEWLSRIQIIPEDLKNTLMGCDYQLSLTVGDISDSADQFEAFGLKWPNA